MYGLSRSARSEHGISLIEFAIVIALVSVSVVTTVQFMGERISDRHKQNIALLPIDSGGGTDCTNCSRPF